MCYRPVSWTLCLDLDMFEAGKKAEERCQRHWSEPKNARARHLGAISDADLLVTPLGRSECEQALTPSLNWINQTYVTRFQYSFVIICLHDISISLNLIFVTYPIGIEPNICMNRSRFGPMSLWLCLNSNLNIFSALGDNHCDLTPQSCGICGQTTCHKYANWVICFYSSNWVRNRGITFMQIGLALSDYRVWTDGWSSEPLAKVMLKVRRLGLGWASRARLAD